jgi:DNA-binding NarL/FixJ family response regulator
MIRVAVVDDHHAIRLGLRTALLAEPGLEPVGSAASAEEAAPLLYRVRPDVVLVDYRLPGVDGLTLCRRIKSDPPAPGVVLFSAFADPSMTAPALVAGVDGIVHKAGQTRDLFDAIRRAARGEPTLPEISPPLLEAAGQALDPDDLPILGMLIRRTAPAEIAATLRIERSELERRVTGMLARLKLSVPADLTRAALAGSYAYGSHRERPAPKFD